MKFSNNDLKTLRELFGDLSENEINELYDEKGFIKVADDYESAYKDFMDFEEGFDGTDLSYDEFLTELKKGYGNSNCIQIARLFELSDGIYYDNYYCG